MSIKISLVIPIYNTQEDILRECLDSVHMQTYSDMEILLVNDGSTDNSPAIIQEYADKDSRIKVFHKENGGASSAKNFGIERASGEYLMQMDCDDYYLDSNVVKDIAELLSESGVDMLSFEYEEFFDNNKKPVFQKGSCPRSEIYEKETQTALKALLKRSPKCFSSVLHTKVIKLQLIRDNEIHYLIGTYGGEDTLYTAQLLKCIRTLDRYDMVAYAFRRSNPNARTALTNKKYLIQHDYIQIFKTIFSDSDSYDNNALLDFMSSPYAYWLGMVAGAVVYCKDDETKQLIQRDIEAMVQYSFVLKHASRPYVKSIGTLCKMFGVRVSIFALRVYLTYNRRHVLSISRKMGETNAPMPQKELGAG